MGKLHFHCRPSFCVKNIVDGSFSEAFGFSSHLIFAEYLYSYLIYLMTKYQTINIENVYLCKHSVNLVWVVFRNGSNGSQSGTSSLYTFC